MKRRLDTQHIETFRAVVMAGSMTQAARQRHTSQPQISRLISQLESIIGFPVFARRGTRISLSIEGARFLEAIEKVYVSVASLETVADNIRSFNAEHLHVTAMPRLASGLLTRAVATFKLDNPGTMVSIHSGTASAVQSWISSGTCDVGLAMNYGNPATGVDSEPIDHFRCVCVLPVGHRLAAKPCITPADLADEDFIAFAAGTSLRAQIDGFFASGKVRPRIVAETDLGASACALVAAGLGASLINPMAAGEESRHARIVVRPIAPELIVTLALLYPPHPQKSRLVRTFEAHVRQAVTAACAAYSVDRARMPKSAGGLPPPPRP